MYAIIAVLLVLYVNVDGMGLMPKSNGFAGLYCTEVTAIYELDQSETPDYNHIIDYDIRLTRISKHAKGITGCIKFKQDIKGPIGAKMKSMKKSDGSGQFLNMALDSVSTDNICKHDSYSTFLKKFNEPFFDDECNFKKGYTCLSPPLDMDKTIHEYCQKLVYGSFNFTMVWMDASEKPVMGYYIGLHFKPIGDCKRKS